MSAFKNTNWMELREVYERGATLTDIRQITGIDRKTILRGLHSVDTVMRKKGHRIGVPNKLKGITLTNHFRECHKCGDKVSRIVIADPPTCRACWDKERRNTPAGKHTYLKNRYGISLLQAEYLMDQQENKCAICSEPINLFAKMWLGGAVVDHDHETGKIRGLLCHGCNIAIGLLEDRGDRLNFAQSYLAKNSAKLGRHVKLFYPIVMLNPKAISIGDNSRIDSFVKLEGGIKLEIGKLVHVASFVHLGVGGGELIIEDGAAIASGAKVITGSNVPGEDHGCSAVDPNAVFKKSRVIIGKNATLFTNSIVCPGVTIGEGAVVLPGAVVTKDVPKGETWGGVPARRINRGGILAVDEIRKQMKLPPLSSVVSKPIDPTKEVIDRIEKEEGKPDFLPKLSSIGEQSLDRWVAAQAEMYCWDD